MKVTEEQYREALRAEKAAKETIELFNKQKGEDFEARWARYESGEGFFTDVELRYSAGARCDLCGAGLAYPKDLCGGLSGPGRNWVCSAVLKGTAKIEETKDGKPLYHGCYPFAFYGIKSEDQPSAEGHTTRPK